MRTIELASWPRRDHFRLFQSYSDPFFDLSAQVAAPGLRDAAKKRGHSPFGVVLHAISAAVQEVAPLRLRLREGGQQVIEHSAAHPAWAVLAPDGTVRFARAAWTPELPDFLAGVEAGAAEARARAGLEGAHDRDDVFYASCMPWMEVTSVRPERSGRPEESVPRFFWGRTTAEGFTLSMTVHHGLVDGLHLGQTISSVEAHLHAYLAGGPR